VGDNPSAARRSAARAIRSDRVRRAVEKASRLLPESKRASFLSLARRAYRKAARTVSSNAAPTATSINSRATAQRKALPTSFRVFPPPEPISDQFPEPPHVEDPAETIRELYPPGGGPKNRYTVELMEQLNAEYAPKPINPTPFGLDATSREDRARKRLLGIHDSIGLAGLRVLEIGCGAGYEVWYLAHHFGSEAHGVDIVERKAWASLADDRTHFQCADITVNNPYEENYFDRVISFGVWEHITHPYTAICETYKIMKPGGIARILANLYRSTIGSHLYRDIFFPWPHLLFSDEVIREFYRRRGEKPRGASWVNKVTWSQYERFFELAGFQIRALRFREREFDEAFYHRFEDVLGRYPTYDLMKDSFTVVLEKPAR
jgi:SAM-dependent methyltransferase